jgi:hypothetical protein
VHISIYFQRPRVRRAPETDNVKRMSLPHAAGFLSLTLKKLRSRSSTITLISNFAPASNSNSLILVYRQLLRHVWNAGLLPTFKWRCIICLLLSFHNSCYAIQRKAWLNINNVTGNQLTNFTIRPRPKWKPITNVRLHFRTYNVQG